MDRFPKLRRKRRIASEHPPVTCVGCGGTMKLATTEPRSTYGIAFARQTYACTGCGNEQTYTMGAPR